MKKVKKKWMSKHRGKIFGLLLLLFVSATIKQKKTKISCYLTPRNVNYGWADQGLFRFNLEQKSIFAPYNKRTYQTGVESDSLHELFYFEDFIADSLLSFSGADTTNEKFIFARMLIIKKQQSNCDSFLIDRNYNVLYQEHTYKLKESLKRYLINKMPKDIQLNWVYDQSRR
ncbi:hypothetical protein [Foetidibacter luteolus]|uniref:hypothetical protein n=1 Tax=Foetidibacter luteolus TaxID=2608880 RepID=UPI00129B6C9B|nr:hypothetical protein [Foetidibacter luteolus]